MIQGQLQAYHNWIRSKLPSQLRHSRKSEGQKIDYYLVNHCSSVGAAVGIQSYLASRQKFQFKTKISKPKSLAVQFQTKYISISFRYQYPKLYFKIHFNSTSNSNSNQNARNYSSK